MLHLYLIIEFMAVELLFTLVSDILQWYKGQLPSNHIQSHNQWEISSSCEIYNLDKINCAFETSCRVNEISIQ